jgi:hypothetical protein
MVSARPDDDWQEFKNSMAEGEDHAEPHLATVHLLARKPLLFMAQFLGMVTNNRKGVTFNQCGVLLFH